MYLINQLILLTHVYSIASYLYSGHEFIQDFYTAADAHRPHHFQTNNPSAPQFLNQPPSQVTFLNETGLVLPCNVYAQPKATIKWLQPNSFDVNSYLLYNNGRHFEFKKSLNMF